MSERLVLIVEDEEKVQEFNRFLLKRQGFNVKTAMTLSGAWKFLENNTPDAIILDRGMPDGDGVDFLKKLRRTSEIPVLLLTGYSEGTDIVLGYESGCDDYVTKPYEFDVLLAKLKRLLQNAEKVHDTIVRGSLRLDLLAGKAFLNDENMLLTQKEFAVFLLFMQNEGKSISAEYIYEKVWQQPLIGDKNAVQAIVSKLRKKIEPHGYEVAVERGQGYAFMKS